MYSPVQQVRPLLSQVLVLYDISEWQLADPGGQVQAVSDGKIACIWGWLASSARPTFPDPPPTAKPQTEKFYIENVTVFDLEYVFLSAKPQTEQFYIYKVTVFDY